MELLEINGSVTFLVRDEEGHPSHYSQFPKDAFDASTGKFDMTREIRVASPTV